MLTVVRHPRRLRARDQSSVMTDDRQRRVLAPSCSARREPVHQSSTYLPTTTTVVSELATAEQRHTTRLGPTACCSRPVPSTSRSAVNRVRHRESCLQGCLLSTHNHKSYTIAKTHWAAAELNTASFKLSSCRQHSFKLCAHTSTMILKVRVASRHYASFCY